MRKDLEWLKINQNRGSGVVLLLIRRNLCSRRIRAVFGLEMGFWGTFWGKFSLGLPAGRFAGCFSGESFGQSFGEWYNANFKYIMT